MKMFRYRKGVDGIINSLLGRTRSIGPASIGVRIFQIEERGTGATSSEGLLGFAGECVFLVVFTFGVRCHIIVIVCLLPCLALTCSCHFDSICRWNGLWNGLRMCSCAYCATVVIHLKVSTSELVVYYDLESMTLSMK